MNTQPLEWSDLWSAMDENPDAWIPTTESMYYERLCVLPPVSMRYGSFLVGEASRHVNGEAVYACFCKTGDNYRARHLTVNQFNQYTT